jgi:CHAT domain-containing protein
MWLFIQPILADLESAGVNNLTFSTDLNLQTISPAVLQNQAGEFLIKKFSVSVAPSLQTIEVDDYVSLKNADVLKMGATEFPDQSALPGVLGELAMVAEVQKEINPGENQLVYLNEQFTIENLEQKIEETGAPIVHLGTHGESSEPDTAYLVLGSEGETTSPRLTAQGKKQTNLYKSSSLAHRFPASSSPPIDAPGLRLAIGILIPVNGLRGTDWTRPTVKT